jgi:hypothetical protein
MYNLLNSQISPKILEEHHVDLKRWSLRLFPSNLTESETIFYKTLKEWMDGFYQFEDKFVWRTSKNGTDYHFADVPQMENELMEHENTVKEYITFFRKYNIIEEVKAFVLKCEEPLKVDFLMIIIDDFRRFLVGFEEDVSHKRFAEIGSYAPHGKNIVSYELNSMVMDLSCFVTKGIRDIEEVVTWCTLTPEIIELNYGLNNDKIIKLLHEELNGNFIETIDFKDFERHFKENNSDFKKLQWKKTQPQLVKLINELEVKNYNKWLMVSNHFYDKKNNKNYDNGMLSVVLDKVHNTLKNEVKDIPKILSRINGVNSQLN